MTAEEARKLSKDAQLGDIEELYKLVAETAKVGKFDYYHDGCPRSALISRLEKDGYAVTTFFDYDHWVTKISWE